MAKGFDGEEGGEPTLNSFKGVCNSTGAVVISGVRLPEIGSV
jgi:hypothetical protein